MEVGSPLDSRGRVVSSITSTYNDLVGDGQVSATTTVLANNDMAVETTAKAKQR
jgi:hypothetical protein